MYELAPLPRPAKLVPRCHGLVPKSPPIIKFGLAVLTALLAIVIEPAAFVMVTFEPAVKVAGFGAVPVEPINNCPLSALPKKKKE